MNTHYCLTLVPLSVALLLQSEPSLLSHAIHAFTHRDPLSMKAASSLPPLAPQPDDIVGTSVRFTRSQFCQLLGQRFQAPPILKAVERRGMSMGERGVKAADLGVKIVRQESVEKHKYAEGWTRNGET